jgi:SAM-dependent methyltransferase
VARLRCHAARLSLTCPACGSRLEANVVGLACPECRRVYPEQQGVLSLAGEARGAPGYAAHFFAGITQLEDQHFWFLVRRKLILERMKRHIGDLDRRGLFDIGCGGGGLLSFLERNGVPVAGACDAYPEALKLARQRVGAALVLVADGQRPPLAQGQTLISMFDVLEHLDDDRGVLRWLASVLAPGGVLVLTVPAHQFLYDEKDRLSHHRLRYARRDLRQKLGDAGFTVLALEHFMALMVLPRLLGRIVSLGTRRSSSNGSSALAIVPGVNRCMYALLEAERLMTLRLRPPFGTSLLAIAARR